METYARNESALRRTARRFSICEDDADDALQRALEILLRRAPSGDPRDLVRWTQTVVKHEALAIRRERERVLPAGRAGLGEDWVELLPSGSDGPAERVERREAVARSREALQALKPQELRALTLLAEGYSYAEIGEITSWSRTKINRCIAEGRERFRNLLSRSGDGSRCAEMQPLISAFCDGEAEAAEAATVREHLRVCAHCRATVRAYRAAPAAALALAPLPLHRSLFERAYDALTLPTGRFRGKTDAVSQVAAGSGSSGIGAATLAKVVAICVGTAGGAATCVATGLVPSPLDPEVGRSQPARLERRVEPAPHGSAEAVGYEPEPAPAAPPAKSEPKPEKPEHQPEAEAAPAAAEPAPESAETATEGGAVEYAPPPEPEPVAEPAPAENPSNGSPAGEFGP